MDREGKLHCQILLSGNGKMTLYIESVTTTMKNEDTTQSYDLLMTNVTKQNTDSGQPQAQRVDNY